MSDEGRVMSALSCYLLNSLYQIEIPAPSPLSMIQRPCPTAINEPRERHHRCWVRKALVNAFRKFIYQVASALSGRDPHNAPDQPIHRSGPPGEHVPHQAGWGALSISLRFLPPAEGQASTGL